MRICADCGRPTTGTTHLPWTGRRSRAKVAEPTTEPPPQPTWTDHPFEDDEVGRVDAVGRRWRICATCGGTRTAHTRKSHTLRLVPFPEAVAELASVSSGGLGEAATRNEPAESPPRPVHPIARESAEVVVLAIALDALLALPSDRVDWLVRTRAAALRDVLDAPTYGTLAPTVEAEPEADDDRPTDRPTPQAVPALDPRPRVASPDASALGALRGIRNDRAKELARRAMKAGWKISILGSGHIALDRGSHRLVLSSTMGDGRRGHSWGNLKATARRAGLDVTGL